MKRLSLENKPFTQIVKEQCWISRSSEGQGYSATHWWKGLDLSNNVCEYDVNLLTNENEENETLTQIVNDAESPPACPHTRPSTLKFRSIYKPIVIEKSGWKPIFLKETPRLKSDENRLYIQLLWGFADENTLNL